MSGRSGSVFDNHSVPRTPRRFQGNNIPVISRQFLPNIAYLEMATNESLEKQIWTFRNEEYLECEDFACGAVNGVESIWFVTVRIIPSALWSVTRHRKQTCDWRQRVSQARPGLGLAWVRLGTNKYKEWKLVTNTSAWGFLTSCSNLAGNPVFTWIKHRNGF